MDDKTKKFRLIAERIKRKLLLKTDKEFAEKIGLNPKAFNARKQSGSIPYPEIIDLSNRYKLDLNWVLTGEGPIYKEEVDLQSDIERSVTDQINCIQQFGKQPRSDSNKQDPSPGGTGQGKITDLITKTIEILESDTVYSGALSANIDAFHEATRTEKKLRDLQVSMERRFTKMEQRMTALETENSDLRKHLDDASDMAANQG